AAVARAGADGPARSRLAGRRADGLGRPVRAGRARPRLARGPGRRPRGGAGGGRPPPARDPAGRGPPRPACPDPRQRPAPGSCMAGRACASARPGPAGRRPGPGDARGRSGRSPGWRNPAVRPILGFATAPPPHVSRNSMNLRNLAIWGVVILIVVGLYSVMGPGAGAPGKAGSGEPAEITYSQMLQRIEAGEVASLHMKADQATITDKEGATATATTPSPATYLEEQARAAGVDIEVESARPSLLLTILTGLLPILLLIAVWIFFMRQMQGGARGAMGFGKSKAKLLTEHKGRKTFEDVAGVDEAK